MQILPIQNAMRISKGYELNMDFTAQNPTSQLCFNKPAANIVTDQISFKAQIPKIFKARTPKMHKYAMKGNWEGIQKELNKGVDINLRDKNMDTILHIVCRYGTDGLLKKLLDEYGYRIDVNAQDRYNDTPIIICSESCQKNKVKLLLAQPNIDVDIKGFLGHTALSVADRNIAELIYIHKKNKQYEMYKKLNADVEAELRNTITEKIRKEERKAAREALSEERKRTDSYYDGRQQAFEQDRATLKRMNDELTRKENALKAREERIDDTVNSKLEKIRQQERNAAENALKDRERILADKENEIKEKNAALDNLIKNYQSLLAADIQHDRNTLASGIRTSLKITLQNLPDDMTFGEQMLYVINILVKRQNKLTKTNDNTPEIITKALQGDDEKISNEGLKFLENVIDCSREKVSEQDLIAAINSVKGNYGLIDMSKTAFFIMSLSWGNNTISSVIPKIEQYLDKAD